MSAVPVRSTAWLLLLGLFASYLALAPGTTDGRGYVPEDREAALQMLAGFNALSGSENSWSLRILCSHWSLYS